MRGNVSRKFRVTERSDVIKLLWKEFVILVILNHTFTWFYIHPNKKALFFAICI